jgi:hypothetical protein
MQALAPTVQTVPHGLVLAQPVLDGQAHLLLPAGSPITSSVLHSLQQRGIQTVFVLQAEPPAVAPAAESGDQQQSALEETQARLLHLFRPALRLDQLNPLLHLILRYRTAKLPAEEP